MKKKTRIMMVCLLVVIFIVPMMLSANSATKKDRVEAEKLQVSSSSFELSTEMTSYFTGDKIKVHILSNGESEGIVVFPKKLEFLGEESSKDMFVYDKTTQKLIVRFGEKDSIDLIFRSKESGISMVYLEDYQSQVLSNKLEFEVEKPKEVLSDVLETEDLEVEEFEQEVTEPLGQREAQEEPLIESINSKLADESGIVWTDTTLTINKWVSFMPTVGTGQKVEMGFGGYGNNRPISELSVFSTSSAHGGLQWVYRSGIYSNYNTSLAEPSATSRNSTGQNYKIKELKEGMIGDRPVIRAISYTVDDIEYQVTLKVSPAGVVTTDMDLVYKGTGNLNPSVFSRVIDTMFYQDSVPVYTLAANNGVYLKHPSYSNKLSIISNVENGPRSYDAGFVGNIASRYTALSPGMASGKGLERFNYNENVLINTTGSIPDSGVALYWNIPALNSVNNVTKMSYKNFVGVPVLPKMTVNPTLSTINIKDGFNIDGYWSDLDGTEATVFYQVGTNPLISASKLENPVVNTNQNFSFLIPEKDLAIGNNTIKIILVDETGSSVIKTVTTNASNLPEIDFTKTITNLSNATNYHVTDTVQFKITAKNNAVGSTLNSGAIFKESVPEGITIDLASVKLNGVSNASVTYDSGTRQLSYILPKNMVYNNSYELVYTGKLDLSTYKKSIAGTEVSMIGKSSLGTDSINTKIGSTIDVIPDTPLLSLDVSSKINGQNSPTIKPKEVLEYTGILTKSNSYSELSEILIQIQLSSGMKDINRDSLKVNGISIDPTSISYDEVANVVSVNSEGLLDFATSELLVTYSPIISSTTLGNQLATTITVTGKNAVGEVLKITKTSSNTQQIAGVLGLKNVPSKLDFGIVDIQSTSQLIMQKDANFSVEIENTLESDWSLKVKAAPLTSGSDTIDNAVVYVNNAGEESVLDGSSKLIATSKSYADAIYPVINWDRTKGVLLRIPPGKAKAKMYQSEITWELNNTPD